MRTPVQPPVLPNLTPVLTTEEMERLQDIIRDLRKMSPPSIADRRGSSHYTYVWLRVSKVEWSLLQSSANLQGLQDFVQGNTYLTSLLWSDLNM